MLQLELWKYNFNTFHFSKLNIDTNYKTTYILRKMFPNSNKEDRNIFSRRIQLPIQVITS